ncbi:MAG: YicC/YloC family endoribonuclease, partial [Eubacteriales bacterium]|nr:YicC/YloC family endoribonuclease [Eubacteriales bacterium]
MNSMTGYGKAAAESDGRKITVEMKSVNHRFLDVTVKIPKVLAFLEDGIRKAVAENFSRGHFDVYVTYENTREDNLSLSINEGVAREYLKIKDILVL